MAHELGSATDWRDLQQKLKDFLTVRNVVSAASMDGGNAGNGTVNQPTQTDGSSGDADNLVETWTVTVLQRVSQVIMDGGNAGNGTVARPTANTGASVEVWTVTVTKNVQDAIMNGGNTGNGTVGTPTVDSGSPVEVFTVTVTDDTTPGSEVWSVVGSVSGAQDAATTGVAYDDIIQFTITAGGTPFVNGDSFTIEVGSEDWSVSGSVSGAQDATESDVAYNDIVQFTLVSGSTVFDVGDFFTFTVGTEEWTVSGSVLGAQDNATTGVAYDDVVQFTITASTVAFDIGDFFTFTVTRKMGTENLWTVESDGTAGGTQDGRFVFKGVGLGGTDEIFVQIRNDSDITTNKYNWECSGFTDFTDPSNGYTFQAGAQPASSLGLPTLFLDDNTINYLFSADGATFIVVAQVGTVFQLGIFGFYERIAPPVSNPYPLCIMGMGGQTDENFTTVSDEHSWGLETIVKHGRYTENDPHKTGSWIRSPGGTWYKEASYYGTSVSSWAQPLNSSLALYWTTVSMQPYGQWLMKDYGDDYALYPIDIFVNKEGQEQQIGSIRRVKYMTGLGATAADIVTDSNGAKHYVTQNAYRVGLKDFAAVLMD